VGVSLGSDPRPLTSDRTKWIGPRPEPASDEMSTSTENDSSLPFSFVYSEKKTSYFLLNKHLLHHKMSVTTHNEHDMD